MNVEKKYSWVNFCILWSYLWRHRQPKWRHDSKKNQVIKVFVKTFKTKCHVLILLKLEKFRLHNGFMTSSLYKIFQKLENTTYLHLFLVITIVKNMKYSTNMNNRSSNKHNLAKLSYFGQPPLWRHRATPKRFSKIFLMVPLDRGTKTDP